MPWTPTAIIVEPDGNPAVVTIKRNSAGGAVVEAYTSENGSSLHGFPKLVEEKTTFWLAGAGAFYVEVLVSGEDAGSKVVTLDPFSRVQLTAVVDAGESAAPAGVIDFSLYVSGSESEDVTSALESAAADALEQGKVLYIPTGRYLLGSAANLFDAAGLKIHGDGPEQSVFVHDGSDYMMDIRGGDFDSTHSLLTSNADAGDLTLTVADTSRLTEGQWANVQSTEIWDATSGKAARYGELVRIKSIDSATQVTLYSPLDYSYTTGNAGKVNYCPLGKGIELKRVGFENLTPLTGTGGAVVFRQTEGLVIEDVTGVSLDGPLLTLNTCVGAVGTRVNGRDMADDENNDRYGYVVNLGEATRGTRISDGHAVNCRHYVTTNAGSGSTAGGVPAHNTIVGCSGTAFTNAVFDCHEEGDDTTFVGCKAYATNDIGFNVRAPRTRLYDCTVDGGLGTGVMIRATATSCSVRNLAVANLIGTQSARSNATEGVRTAASETVIDGFYIRNIGQSGIVVSGNRCVVRNGFIYAMGTDSNPHGVRFSGSSKDHTVENVMVDGNGIASRPMTASSGAGTVTGIKVRNLVGRRVSGGPTNFSGLDIVLAPNTEVSEWVTNTPTTSRLATGTSTTMLGTSVLVGVTSTAAARTITLPAASAVPVGVIFRIKDESGGAGTNNITVQRAGSDTIDGGTSVTISTNYGVARVYSTGSAWFTA